MQQKNGGLNQFMVLDYRVSVSVQDQVAPKPPCVTFEITGVTPPGTRRLFQVDRLFLWLQERMLR